MSARWLLFHAKPSFLQNQASFPFKSRPLDLVSVGFAPWWPWSLLAVSPGKDLTRCSLDHWPSSRNPFLFWGFLNYNSAEFAFASWWKVKRLTTARDGCWVRNEDPVQLNLASAACLETCTDYRSSSGFFISSAEFCLLMSSSKDVIILSFPSEVTRQTCWKLVHKLCWDQLLSQSVNNYFSKLHIEPMGARMYRNVSLGILSKIRQAKSQWPSLILSRPWVWRFFPISTKSKANDHP